MSRPACRPPGVYFRSGAEIRSVSAGAATPLGYRSSGMTALQRLRSAVGERQVPDLALNAVSELLTQFRRERPASKVLPTVPRSVL